MLSRWTIAHFTKLPAYLQQVPAVDPTMGHGGDQSEGWWVKFTIDIDHELAWTVVQDRWHQVRRKAAVVAWTMAVSMKRWLWSYVRKNSDSFWLQLATEDDERAAAALERAVDAIRSVPHPNEPDEPAASYVSDVERVPGGPCISCDFKDLPDAVLRRALDAVVASLEADGIDGTLQPPPDRKDAPFWTVLADGHHTPPYPVGWALLVMRDPTAPHRTPMPDRWLEPLCRWALDGTDSDELIWASVVSMAFPLPAASLPRFLRRAMTIVAVACGRVDDRLRHIDHRGDHLVISERGPSVRGEALDRSADGLVALARELAPESPYIALDYPATRTRFGEHTFPVHNGSFRRTPTYLPGAYPWQLLHRPVAEALDCLPPAATWIGDHVELAFGERAAWADANSRDAEEAEAEQALSPLLRKRALGVRVRAVPGTWGTGADLRSTLDAVDANVWLASNGRFGEARGHGGYVAFEVFGDPPACLRLRPNESPGSQVLADALIDALRGAAGGREVVVIRP
jgi:hypothetical protein